MNARKKSSLCVLVFDEEDFNRFHSWWYFLLVDLAKPRSTPGKDCFLCVLRALARAGIFRPVHAGIFSLAKPPSTPRKDFFLAIFAPWRELGQRS
jgi:hypothetical protein